MTLTSSRFASNSRLQAAANNSPVMRQGERGDAVAIVQQAFVDLGFSMPITTGNGRKSPDGIFGQETARTVRDFQAQHGLMVDSIVGTNTMATLDRLFADAKVEKDKVCGNCFESPRTAFVPLKDTPTKTTTARSRFTSSSFKAKSADGEEQSDVVDDLKELIKQIRKMKVPKDLRPLTGPQEKIVDSVFGKSIDYSKVLISNGLGFNGRAFVTVATIEILGQTLGPKIFKGFTIMNLGTFSPSRSLLMHEITHVWQSQHHPVKHQFMINAVASQRLAEEARANGLKTASAYAPEPAGRTWAEYAAEQNAARIEAGQSAASTHVRSAKKNVADLQNIVSLSTPKFGLR